MTSQTFDNGPLTGIKVLDISAVIAGPWASTQLADMGADVIFAERVEGADVMRLTGPIKGDQSGCWVAMHRNKRGIALNLRDPEAVAIVKKLANEADIFLQNFRPGVADRLGLGYDELASANPELIYVSISGFGPTGPYSGQPVYDPIVQGLGGMAHAQGGDFVKSVVADKSTAMTAANAALAALVGRQNGAGGQHIEITLIESLLNWMWPDVFWNESLPDQDPVPTYTIWYAPYDTSDGQLSAVWVSYEQFQAAARAVGIPAVAEDDRFATREGRLHHSLEMRAAFGRALKDLTTEDAVAALRNVDVPCAPCLSRNETLLDPQVQHLDVVVEDEHPTAGRTVTVRPPAKFSKTPGRFRSHAPGRGEHTAEVLTEMGYDADSIRRLKESGAIL